MIINTEKKESEVKNRYIEVLERNSNLQPTKIRLVNYDIIPYALAYSSYGQVKQLYGLNKVKGIETYGIWGMSNWDTSPYLVLPSTIDYIESKGVGSNGILKKIEIGAKELRKDCFYNNANLEAVWIRESCTSIIATKASEAPFANCSKANFTIYLEADEKPAGFSTFFNRKGSGGGQIATVVYGQKTNPLI